MSLDAEPVSILLVDDRKDKLLALRSILGELNQRLVEVTSGEDALRALLKEDFAAIVLDVNMPGMDGLETALLIRKRKRSEHTPIIFVTGLDMNPGQVSRGYSIGAVDYIFTPVDPIVLRSKISVFIDLFRKTRQVKRQEELLRLQAERRALNLEDRLDNLLNRLNVGVFQSTMNGGCIECNPSVRRILGVSADMPPELIDFSFLQDPSADYIGERVIQINRNDGTNVWLSISTRAGSLEGEPIMEGIIEDVTQAKEAEDALRQSQSRYMTLIEAMPQLVWTSRPNGEWDFASVQWCDYTGFANSTEITQRWLELVHPDDRESTIRSWRDAVTACQIYDVEHRLRDSEGNYRWFTTRAVPLREDDGSVQRWFGTSTDIQERKQIETELTNSARLKDEFLAMLSHELRNPLNAINSALQVVRLKGGDEVAKAPCEVIQRQVKQLVRLIDDLLDVSRITRGKIELRREVLDVRKVVEAAKTACHSIIEERRHSVQLVAAGKPIQVWADPARFEQVIVNLLVNAAKYTPEGGKISLTIGQVNDWASIIVKDSGIGLAPDVLPRVFDLFVQADVSLARSKGGLGIGLTVAKNLAELHGGYLLARSEGKGKGAEFELRIPLVDAATKSEPAPVADHTAPEGLKVLLVDDHVDTLECTKLLLEQFNCVVETCSEGAGVVELAKKFNPNLILLDIGLPGMNGYEVASALRAEPQFADTILVALSGYGQEEDRKNSKLHGFDLHIVKPLDLDLLFSSLSELTGEGNQKEVKAKLPDLTQVIH